MSKDRARFRATGYPMGRPPLEEMTADRVRFKETDPPPKRATDEEEDPLKDFRPSDTAVSVIAGPPSESLRYCTATRPKLSC